MPIRIALLLAVLLSACDGAGPEPPATFETEGYDLPGGAVLLPDGTVAVAGLYHAELVDGRLRGTPGVARFDRDGAFLGAEVNPQDNGRLDEVVGVLSPFGDGLAVLGQAGADGVVLRAEASGRTTGQVFRAPPSSAPSLRLDAIQPLAGGGGVVALSSTNGPNLYALAPDGSVRWTYRLEEGNGYNVSVVRAMGSDDLFVLGAADRNRSNGETEALVVARVTPDRTERWRRVYEGLQHGPAAGVEDGLALLGGRRAVDPETYTVQVTRLDGDGDVAWVGDVASTSTPRFRSQALVGLSDDRVAVAVDDADGDDGSSTTSVVVLGPDGGRERAVAVGRPAGERARTVTLVRVDDGRLLAVASVGPTIFADPALNADDADVVVRVHPVDV